MHGNIAKQSSHGGLVQALRLGKGDQTLHVRDRGVAGDHIDARAQGHHLQCAQGILLCGKALPLQLEHVPGEQLGEMAARCTVGTAGRAFCVSQTGTRQSGQGVGRGGKIQLGRHVGFPIGVAKNWPTSPFKQDS